MEPQILKLYISLELTIAVAEHPKPVELLNLIEKHVFEYINEKGLNSEYNNDEVVIQEQIIEFKGEIRPFSVLLETFDNNDEDIHLNIKFTEEDDFVTEYAEYEITPTILH